MKTYTFYLHRGSAVPTFEIELFESREIALSFARALLAHRPRYDQVVVTEEDEEIARIERPVEHQARSEQRWAAGA